MIYLETSCYVLHAGYYNDILKQKDNLILYPERALTKFQLRSGIVYGKSIVTESVEMISCYSAEKVFVWRKNENGVGEWINPKDQTFGTSYELLESSLLFYDNSIPMNIISRDIAVKLKDKLNKLYS